MSDSIPSMLHDLFVPAIPLAEKVLRPMLVYVFLIVGIRLASGCGRDPYNGQGLQI